MIKRILVFYFILFTMLCFPVSALESYQLELRDGKVITFTTFSKIGEKALKVITDKGNGLTITRKQLSDAEIIRRFGSLFLRNYGKAYPVQSKLPKDYNPYEFRDSIKVRYEQMELLKWKNYFADLKYYLFKPDKKNIKSGEKVPLVIFFHGMGDQNHMGRHPQCLIFVQPEIQKKYPCYFIAPMLNNDKFDGWRGKNSLTKHNCTGSMESLFLLIDDMITRYPNIDGDRIYVTGLSSGGIACWEAIAKYPERFAGAVPIAGASSALYEEMAKMKNKLKIGIWAFCNTTEIEYNRKYSIGLLKRVAKLGSDARYSTFRITKQYDRDYKHSSSNPKLSSKHSAQNWAYAEPDLIPWLFSQKRTSAGK